MKIIRVLLALAFNAMLLLPASSQADDVLRVAITTTIENSGLSRLLDRAFTEYSGTRVQTVIHGSGQALRTAREGNVDVVIAHAPALEQAFIEGGWGMERHGVMHNDFIIVGPADDPAGIRDSDTAAGAFDSIAAARQRFVSRGDNSGTHIKERLLWQKAGVEPGGRWYIPAGAGMGKALIMADNMGAYTLTDRGTYLAFGDRLDLELLYEGDGILYNPYHVIIVNPEKHPHTNVDLARKYVQFITGEQGQQVISDYRIDGRSAFIPGVTEGAARNN